jgi:hypothetical protein
MTRRRLQDEDRFHIYKIDPNNLKIPEEKKLDIKNFINNYSQDVILKYLNSSDLDTMKYGLLILRHYLNIDSKENSLTFNLQDFYLTDFICRLLLHADNSIRVVNF